MFQPGKIVKNRYKINRYFTSGGFGNIYEVSDRHSTKILKILKPVADAEKQQIALKLFRREAEVLQQLNHPGIPRVDADGYFLWRDGSEIYPCLIMEKIPGKTLEQWRQNNEKPLTQSQALDWFEQMVIILDYLHQNNYLHRDLKPSNIILKPNGKLAAIDFGSVRPINGTYLAKFAENLEVTKILTQGYAPEEQARGKPVPQSDFFALGRTFVYLLTGKEPKEIPENLDTCELLWREFATEISDNFADLIDWAIAPFATERPPDTQAILQRLREIESNLKPTEIKQKKSREKIQWQKPGLAGVAGVAIALLFSFSSALPNLATFLNDLGVNNHLNKRLNLAQFFYKSAILLDSKYHSPHYNLGVIYETKKQFELAIPEYRTAIKLKPDFAVGYKNLGRLYLMQQGRYYEAETILQTALNLPLSEETEYGISKNLGLTYFYQKQYPEAQTYLEKAIGLKPERAAPYCLLGRLLENKGKNGDFYWQQCQRYADKDTSKEVEHLLFSLELD